jgi:hypothetical protein
MIGPVGTAHNAVADVLEATAETFDWIDPTIAILEQVKRPFGCEVLAITLDSREGPIYYLRLLERSGIEILGIELFGLRVGVCICNRALLVTIKKEDAPKAVKVLARHGARFVY